MNRNQAAFYTCENIFKKLIIVFFIPPKCNYTVTRFTQGQNTMLIIWGRRNYDEKINKNVFYGFQAAAFLLCSVYSEISGMTRMSANRSYGLFTRHYARLWFSATVARRMLKRCFLTRTGSVLDPRFLLHFPVWFRREHVCIFFREPWTDCSRLLTLSRTDTVRLKGTCCWYNFSGLVQIQSGATGRKAADAKFWTLLLKKGSSWGQNHHELGVTHLPALLRINILVLVS